MQPRQQKTEATLAAAVVRKTSVGGACPEPVQGRRRRADRGGGVRRGDQPGKVPWSPSAGAATAALASSPSHLRRRSRRRPAGEGEVLGDRVMRGERLQLGDGVPR